MLALAIARGAQVDAIRGLWMNDGAIEKLLRDPLEKDALSLLRGDAHLLSCLSAAMDQIAASGSGGDVREPLDLTVTGTTLVGEARGYADLYGSVLPDVDHRGQFRFRRTPDHPADDSAGLPHRRSLRWRRARPHRSRARSSRASSPSAARGRPTRPRAATACIPTCEASPTSARAAG